jgi:predicted small lipoprotein YifL
MKIRFKHLIIAAFIFSFAGCNAPKEQEQVTDKLQTEKPATDFISGKVIEIQGGKDGYTAKINSPGNKEYFATISRANLTDPATYKTVNIGDTISVKGDTWQMKNETYITVQEMK